MGDKGMAAVCLFQSTLPVRGGTRQRTPLINSWRFQSTLPVRGGTQRIQSVRAAAVISIHPPREGRDPSANNVWGAVLRFQSTLPVRGGTSAHRITKKSVGFQSTLPVRGGTAVNHASTVSAAISIHPPREGRDSESAQKVLLNLYTLDKFSHIFHLSYPVFRERSGKQSEIFPEIECEGPQKNLGASPSHGASPSGCPLGHSRA